MLARFGYGMDFGLEFGGQNELESEVSTHASRKPWEYTYLLCGKGSALKYAWLRESKEVIRCAGSYLSIFSSKSKAVSSTAPDGNAARKAWVLPAAGDLDCINGKLNIEKKKNRYSLPFEFSLNSRPFGQTNYIGPYLRGRLSVKKNVSDEVWIIRVLLYPKCWNILSTWSVWKRLGFWGSFSLPGKRGFVVINSANIHPMAQIFAPELKKHESKRKEERNKIWTIT